MFKKIVLQFLRYDIRWKIIKISKFTKINFFPKIFNFKRSYHKFIYKLIYNEKSKKLKKIIFKKILERQKLSEKNLRFLVSPPGSGSTFVRCLLSSYIEIYFKIGNGIPKFNNITNKWLFSVNPILSADLFNSVILDEAVLKENNENFFSKKNFYNLAVNFTRHPYKNSRIDLYKIEKSKLLILFREPYDWMISQYTRYEKKSYVNRKQINISFIRQSLLNLNEYYKYWIDFSKYNKKKVLFIDYKTLTKKSEKSFLQICKFYNYDISNKTLIKKCVKFNSKNYSLKMISTTFKGTRFSNNSAKEKIKKKISKCLKEELNKCGIKYNYNKIMSKVPISLIK